MVFRCTQFNLWGGLGVVETWVCNPSPWDALECPAATRQAVHLEAQHLHALRGLEASRRECGSPAGNSPTGCACFGVSHLCCLLASWLLGFCWLVHRAQALHRLPCHMLPGGRGRGPGGLRSAPPSGSASIQKSIESNVFGSRPPSPRAPFCVLPPNDSVTG